VVDRANFINQVNTFLQDSPEFNALINRQETSLGLISLCADLAMDDFSHSPPLIGTFSVETTPYLYLLFIGTLIQILRSQGLLQARNNLNYSDGGLTVATSDKSPVYKAWADSYFQEYESKKRTLKMSLNAASAYGGVSSEYMFIGAYGQYLGLANMDNFTALRYGFFVF
jgi:hypothetical protein